MEFPETVLSRHRKNEESSMKKTRLGVEWLETRENPSGLDPIDPTGLPQNPPSPPANPAPPAPPGDPIAPPH
jgi:hypothetical protein